MNIHAKYSFESSCQYSGKRALLDNKALGGLNNYKEGSECFLHAGAVKRFARDLSPSASASA
jgi:hypothetical protein